MTEPGGGVGDLAVTGAASVHRSQVNGDVIPCGAARPWLLDLYCGAGGAAMGYHRAGFDIVGVDIRPQPHYPFLAVQVDALVFLRVLTGGRWYRQPFAAVHASPPCEAHSRTQQIRQREHPDLIGPTRELLELTGLPYVIENVPGAPLKDPVVLEGQMFEGLRTQRARWFEANWPLDVPFLRSPRPAPLAMMGRPAKPDEWLHVVGNFHGAEAGREAMGIDWMTRDELADAIPPAYTEMIGGQLLEHLRVAA